MGGGVSQVCPTRGPAGDGSGPERSKIHRNVSVYIIQQYSHTHTHTHPHTHIYIYIYQDIGNIHTLNKHIVGVYPCS